MSATKEIIKNIQSLTANSSLLESDYKSILERIESFGYSVNMQSDSFPIAFAIEKVENYVKNNCNVTVIPDGLKSVVIDRVCGEFLFAKNQIGGLDETFNIETAVKQIQTGDTNVTFAIGEGSQTPEQRLNNLITYLIAKGEGEFVCYRKVKW